MTLNSKHIISITIFFLWMTSCVYAIDLPTLSEIRQANPHLAYYDSLPLAQKTYQDNPEIAESGVSFEDFVSQIDFETDHKEQKLIKQGYFNNFFKGVARGVLSAFKNAVGFTNLIRQ